MQMRSLLLLNLMYSQQNTHINSKQALTSIGEILGIIFNSFLTIMLIWLHPGHFSLEILLPIAFIFIEPKAFIAAHRPENAGQTI